MDRTTNLKIPYILMAQAQKHVTHNEALLMIDALMQMGVQSRAMSEPPADLADGARFIVPETAAGAWIDQHAKIAAWQDGGWRFYQPVEGWIAFCSNENRLLVFHEGSWQVLESSIDFAERLGINATADGPNRLALAGDASLFNHEGAGHQVKINKAAATDTASILYQTGFSGRAEFGLTGDDDFHLKVSGDGETFIEAMVVQSATGVASFPAGISGVRERLVAPRTLFVASSGSDAADGLSPDTAFATLQRAVDAAHMLDCMTFDVTIQLGAGMHSGAAVLRPLVGGGLLRIEGDDADASTVVVSSSILAGGGARVLVSGIRFVMASPWMSALTVEEGAMLTLGVVDFGPCGANGSHIAGTGFGQINFLGDYTISGGALRHFNLSGHLMVTSNNQTVTLLDDPAFIEEFAFVSNGAVLSLWNATFLGMATGRRYTATTNGTISLFGAGEAFLPGNGAGIVTAGGILA
jgi:hypothetical protein